MPEFNFTQERARLRALYEIQQQGSKWVVFSGGYKLGWYFTERQYAENYIQDLIIKRINRSRSHRPRDSKKQQCYQAEWFLTAINRGLPKGDLIQYCQQLAIKAGLKPLAPRFRWATKAATHSWATYTEVVLKPGAGMEILLHEYAHVLTWENRPGHDITWAEAYTKLVYQEYGEEVGNKLRENFARVFRTSQSTGNTMFTRAAQNNQPNEGGGMSQELKIKLSGTTARDFDLSGLPVTVLREFKRGKGSVKEISVSIETAKELVNQLKLKDTKDSGVSYDTRYAFRLSAKQIEKQIAKAEGTGTEEPAAVTETPVPVEPAAVEAAPAAAAEG